MTVLQELRKDHFLADKHACVLVTVVNVAMGLSGDDLVYKIIKNYCYCCKISLCEIKV
jgi:hypothetical protein